MSVTPAPEPTGLEAQLDRLIQSAAAPQTSGSSALPRLEALLAAAAAPDAGPQPGELEALASFRELVVGTGSRAVGSLAAHRRRRQLAVVAITSTVVALGGGVAAAASGSLPGAAQSTAKSMLGALGVHVPGPNQHAGTHPDERGKSGQSHGNPAPSASEPSQADEPVAPTHPAHPTTPASSRPTAGNSGTSRHHGNPTPASTTHPTPQHGKPAAPPAVAHTHITTHATRIHHIRIHPMHERVMRAQD